jgi:hypothetical protein
MRTARASEAGFPSRDGRLIDVECPGHIRLRQPYGLTELRETADLLEPVDPLQRDCLFYDA